MKAVRYQRLLGEISVCANCVVTLKKFNVVSACKRSEAVSLLAGILSVVFPDTLKEILACEGQTYKLLGDLAQLHG